MEGATQEPRLYTDDRFPGINVVNDGTINFEVTENGVPIDTFIAYEKAGVPAVSEPFAQRRARAYFDRMAKGSMSVELSARDEESPQSVPIKNLANRLKWQPKEHGTNPLAGMREMTPDDVDSVIAAARAEQDPAKREALFKQAGSMMMQQESAAQKVVRMLLNL